MLTRYQEVLLPEVRFAACVRRFAQQKLRTTAKANGRQRPWTTSFSPFDRFRRCRMFLVAKFSLRGTKRFGSKTYVIRYCCVVPVIVRFFLLPVRRRGIRRMGVTIQLRIRYVNKPPR